MLKAHRKSFQKLYIVTDMLLLAAAFVLAYAVRFGLYNETKKHLSFAEYLDYLPEIVLGYAVIFIFCGLYGDRRSHSVPMQLWEVIRANVFGSVYFLALLYMYRVIDVSRTFIFVFAVFNTLIDITARLVLIGFLRYLRRRGKNKRHVLMVGYSRTAEAYMDRILANPHWGFKADGILDDNMEPGTRYRDTKVVGRIADLSAYLKEHAADLDEVVISLKVNDYDRLDEVVAETEKYGLHIRFAPDFMKMINSDAEIDDMDGVAVINIRRIPLANVGNRILKRAEDIIIGICAIIVAAIPMAITAVAVKMSSKGPVIYKQTRVGLHNREFTMYKFRSMTVQKTEDEKKEWTTENDPRVTRVGRFIRKTSIDELPQLLNVIKGDMSIVGPRPERPQFVEKFTEEIPRYNIKHQVRPGITGWAQVHGYRGDTSITRRIEHDIWYIENWTLGLDFVIMFRTIFKGKDYNAY